MSSTDRRLDIASLRDRLAGQSGRAFWRSLEEVAETEEFRELLQREFPRDAAVLESAASRRDFLRLAAASLALGGLYSCSRQPAEKILPYAQAPEGIVPGEPLFFATAAPLDGQARGVLVESHMGRPTKIEGNPDHPASLGATDVFAQAEILSLYDPDRSQAVRNAGRISNWTSFLQSLAPELAILRTNGGRGLRLLTGAVSSPTLTAQIGALLEEFPEARWHAHEPAAGSGAAAGARLAFGRDLDVRYRFDLAEVVLALDADFLGTGPASVRYARDFAARRRVARAGDGMNRLYAVEPSPTVTGAMADHRLPLGAARVEEFARALRAELDGDRADADPEFAGWIAPLARDLAGRRGRTIVLAGNEQPAAVHALALAINQRLGNVGETVVPIRPVCSRRPQPLDELQRAMAGDEVELLVMVGGNPAYTAGPEFAAALDGVRLRVHLGHSDDETARLCHWHVPLAHFLETWGDLRAFDGTVSIQQPLIAPLYAGKSPLELVAALRGAPDRSAHQLVQEHWRSVWGGDEFQRRWNRALHDGLVPDTAFAPEPGEAELRPALPARTPRAEGLELHVRPDPCVWDGSFANNGWLQELPKPLTKLTWDNAALLSPADAERLDLRNEDVVELSTEAGAVRAPVWILPGQAPGTVTVHLGYGRTRAGRVGSGVGFDAARLRGPDEWFGPLAGLRPVGERYPLACTQSHHSMEGRDLARSADLAEFAANPDFATEHDHEVHSLYPEWEYEGYAWGMSVDLNTCIGCNACMVACQSENNIPIVGKEQVRIGREMHWIRLDRYFAGGLDDPQTLHQPVMCQHCEKAPCEVVCPVAATVHDDEGLNAMVYNRCVGTRYCSNNCPYKVRRFNFLEYNGQADVGPAMARNPDVTVRSRGVMEKCTYCVQRISAGRRTARKEDRPIRDGEVRTACQSACPTEAIVFGDLNTKDSAVQRAKADPRSYSLLGGLGTAPRTTYQAKLRNPNPELDEDAR